MFASRRSCNIGGRATPRSAGFTIVEVLVAFVIVGFTLASTISTFETGLAGVERAESHATALMLAESKLAEIGVTAPLAVGRWEGDFAGAFRWRTDIIAITEPASEVASVVAAYRVVVEVESLSAVKPGRRLVRLQTVRLGVDQLSNPSDLSGQ